MLWYTTIIKYGSTAVVIAKALFAQSRLANFLTKVDHYRASIHRCGYNHARYGQPVVTGKIIGGNALLIMIFHKTQHMLVNIPGVMVPNVIDLPGACTVFVTG